MPQLTSKSQVTLPREAREALGVGPGDSVEFRVVGRRVEVVRAMTLAFDAGRDLFGSYSSGVGNRSANRKALLGEILREKPSRR